MPRLQSANFVMTELAEQILNTSTSPLNFTVNDASEFPDAPFKILIHDETPEFAGVKEIMEVGAIDKVTGVLSSVTRAQEGTSAQTHAIGAKVECVWTAGTHGELIDGVDFDNHSVRHENLGVDAINVQGLPGELADNQPPKVHSATHENLGADAINLAGLAGESTELGLHKADTVNPHSVTKTQVALGNVENKSAEDIRTESTTALAIEVRTTDPTSPAVGRMWLRSDL